VGENGSAKKPPMPPGKVSKEGGGKGGASEKGSEEEYVFEEYVESDASWTRKVRLLIYICIYMCMYIHTYVYTCIHVTS
jgi:hypothetical protein